MGKKQNRQKSSKDKKGNKSQAQKKHLKNVSGDTKGKIEGQKNQLIWPLVSLATLGMALTAYLVFTNWFGESLLYCEDGSSCDIVQQSRWGAFLGVPTALFGFLIYAILAFIGIRTRDVKKRWQSSWVISLLGLGYSIYLLAISLFVVDAVCIYCLASFSILLCIFVWLTLNRPKEKAHFNFIVWARQFVVVTVIIIGGLHLHYSGVFDPAAGPEDPYLKGLALHLAQENVLLYGAFW